MKNYKVVYVDVSKMTAKETANILGVELVPWWKDELYLLVILGIVSIVAAQISEVLS